MTPILKNFLFAQLEESQRIQALNSERVMFLPDDRSPPQRYVVAFLGASLVNGAHGPRVEKGEFHVGVHFPDDYMLRADAGTILTWLHPRAIFHPNILPQAGAVCLRITPGMPLLEIVHTLWDTINFFIWATDSALNRDAAQFVRRHVDMFPLKAPALRRTSAEPAPKAAPAPGPDTELKGEKIHAS